MPILIALLAALAAPDEIYRKGATRPIKGNVVSETYQTVEYRREGVSQTLELPAANVDRIVYDDAPEAYLQGLSQLEAGQGEDAVKSFKVALQSKTRNNWVEVHASYRIGLAYALMGAKDAANYRLAAAEFQQLMEKHPENRFLADALKRWGDCLAAAGNATEAAKVYDRLATEAKGKDLGLRWEALAMLAKADAFAAAKDPQAEQAYQAAGTFAKANASANEEDGELVQLLQEIAGKAQLSRGEALLAAGKIADARRFFEQIVQGADSSPSAVAGAMCGIGQALLAEDKADEALEQFANARVAHFLISDQAARATYLMGECCLALGSAEPNGKGKARAYFQEVADRYPGTAWAEKARAQLQ